MNKRDTFYFWYFIVHIPVTIIIGACLVILKENRYWLQQMAFDFHVITNKDFLLADPPLWLQIFGWIELFYQLPISFLAAVALKVGSKKIYVTMAIYGSTAFLTSVVGTSYAIAEEAAHGLTMQEMRNLFLLYFPYVVIPLGMMIDCSSRAANMIETPSKEKTE